MKEYKTICYPAGKQDFDDEVIKELKDGWAVYRIFDNPNYKWNSRVSFSFMITYIRNK